MAKFDLQKTAALAELFRTGRDNRDTGWIAKFYATVPDATLMSFDPQVEKGPDHFPYFQMAIPDAGPVTPFCVTHVLDHVLDSGYGIAIFGDSSRSIAPEWVFTYGDLLSYSLCGRFDGAPSESVGGAPGDKDQVLRAAPSEAYLPARARKVLGSYMRQVFQHPDPKVALLVVPRLKPSRNLVINLSLQQYRGDSRKLNAAMNYLLWFLPRSYSLVAMPEGWDDSSFVPLL